MNVEAPIRCYTCNDPYMQLYVNAYLTLIGDGPEPIIDPGLALDLVTHDNIITLMADLNNIRYPTFLKRYYGLDKAYMEGDMQDWMYRNRSMLLVQSDIELYVIRVLLQRSQGAIGLKVPNIREYNRDYVVIAHVSDYSYLTEFYPDLITDETQYPIEAYSLALPDDIDVGVDVIGTTPLQLDSDGRRIANLGTRVNRLITVPEFIMNTILPFEELKTGRSVDNVEELYRFLMNVMAYVTEETQYDVINTYCDIIIQSKQGYTQDYSRALEELMQQAYIEPYNFIYMSEVSNAYIRYNPYNPSTYQFEIRDLVSRRIEGMTHKKSTPDGIVMLTGADAFRAKIRDLQKMCCKMNIQSYAATYQSRAMKESEAAIINVRTPSQVVFMDTDVPIPSRSTRYAAGATSGSIEGSRGTLPVRIAQMPIMGTNTMMPRTAAKRQFLTTTPTSRDITPIVSIADEFKRILSNGMSDSRPHIKKLAREINEHLRLIRRQNRVRLYEQLMTKRITDKLVDADTVQVSYMLEQYAEGLDEDNRALIESLVKSIRYSVTDMTTAIILDIIRKDELLYTLLDIMSQAGAIVDTTLPINVNTDVAIDDLNRSELLTLAIKSKINVKPIMSDNEIRSLLSDNGITSMRTSVRQHIDISEVDMIRSEIYIAELERLGLKPVSKIDSEYAIFIQNASLNDRFSKLRREIKK